MSQEPNPVLDTQRRKSASRLESSPGSAQERAAVFGKGLKFFRFSETFSALPDTKGHGERRNRG
jgi:hypothetical protein